LAPLSRRAQTPHHQATQSLARAAGGVLALLARAPRRPRGA
jgi:hypothetical protein